MYVLSEADNGTYMVKQSMKEWQRYLLIRLWIKICNSKYKQTIT